MCDFVIFSCVFGYLAYLAHMYIYRPEQWAQMLQRKHDLKMAKEAEKTRWNNDARGKIVTSVAGAATKFILDALFKRKH
jgi:hypothetical protein